METTQRGQASGTSIHSIHPLRPPRVEVLADYDATRLTSAIHQTGRWSILIVTVYGYPTSHPNSAERTNKLLTRAAAIAAEVALPTIICGDFNVPADDMPLTEALLDLGYLDLRRWYRQVHQHDMPPTCRGVTWPDQAFIHKHLLPHLQAVTVEDTHVFHDHKPILLDFHLPGEGPFVQSWTLPASWLPFEPSATMMEASFAAKWKASDAPTTLTEALRTWTQACEHSVQTTVQKQHNADPVAHPQARLPKRCIGRTGARTLTKKPIVPGIRRACQGQYNPPLETSGIRYRQQVKQLRRLQSFHHRYAKLQYVTWTDHQNQQLAQEWEAIVQAQGFPPTFPRWCLNHIDIGFFPLDFPDENFLQHLVDIIRHHCDMQGAADRTLRLQQAKLQKKVTGSYALKGQVKVTDPEKGFVFVDCPEVYEFFGRDVYVPKDRQGSELTERADRGLQCAAESVDAWN
eukprot:Skav228404  [mRNA]  locus=scaffold3824:94096:106675:- [translate_table: standard]